MTDLADTILENAAKPAKASGDAGSFEQHKLADLIEADKYLQAQTGLAKTTRGLRFNKFVPPGAD